MTDLDKFAAFLSESGYSLSFPNDTGFYGLSERDGFELRRLDTQPKCILEHALNRFRGITDTAEIQERYANRQRVAVISTGLVILVDLAEHGGVMILRRTQLLS